LGIFWRNSELKMLVYFISIWNIYCHLVFCRAIWYILWPFGIFYGRLEILQTFGIFSPFWCAVQKNLATLVFLQVAGPAAYHHSFRVQTQTFLLKLGVRSM
jgi:hypothetical protein